MLTKHQKQFFLVFLAVLAAFLLIRPDFSLQAGLPTAKASASIPFNLRATPNPFNPTTTIAFDVVGGDGTRQPVRVEVFDITGRRVATLLEQTMVAGPHSVPWSADTPGGLYFARVTVAGVEKTIKLSLVK